MTTNLSVRELVSNQTTMTSDQIRLKNNNIFNFQRYNKHYADLRMNEGHTIYESAGKRGCFTLQALVNSFHDI